MPANCKTNLYVRKLTSTFSLFLFWYIFHIILNIECTYERLIYSRAVHAYHSSMDLTNISECNTAIYFRLGCNYLNFHFILGSDSIISHAVKYYYTRGKCYKLYHLSVPEMWRIITSKDFKWLTVILFSRNLKYISALAFITTTSLKTTSSSLGSYLNKKIKQTNKTKFTHFHSSIKLINSDDLKIVFQLRA